MYLAVDRVPLAAMFATLRGHLGNGISALGCQRQDGRRNLLEITEPKWTLIHRDKGGSTTILAVKKY